MFALGTPPPTHTISFASLCEAPLVRYFGFFSTPGEARAAPRPWKNSPPGVGEFFWSSFGVLCEFFWSLGVWGSSLGVLLEFFGSSFRRAWVCPLPGGVLWEFFSCLARGSAGGSWGVLLLVWEPPRCARLGDHKFKPLNLNRFRVLRF